MRPVRDAAMPLGDGIAVGEADRLDRVAEIVGGGDSAIVLRDGQLVGSITAADLSRWLRAASIPGGEPEDRAAGWAACLSPVELEPLFPKAA